MSLAGQPSMTTTGTTSTTTTTGTTGTLDPVRVNVRVKISALWAAMMFVFAYVDLFSLFRADVRAELEAGKIWAFPVGQGFLLGATAYVAVPSLLVFLSLVLPARAARWASMVLAAVYLLTVVGGAVGESYHYYLFGSALEVAVLVAIFGYAWTWPRLAQSHPARGNA